MVSAVKLNILILIWWCNFTQCVLMSSKTFNVSSSPKIINTIHLVSKFHNFALAFPIILSSFRASPVSPLILSFPDIKAVVGLNFPANIFWKFSLFNVTVTSALFCGSPLPTEPFPFFKSMNQTPVSSPEITNRKSLICFTFTGFLYKIAWLIMILCRLYWIT